MGSRAAPPPCAQATRKRRATSCACAPDLPEQQPALSHTAASPHSLRCAGIGALSRGLAARAPQDVNCKAGGLGCNAGGHESCRFCGFDFSATGGTDYSSVVCPAAAGAGPAEAVALTTVTVAGTCPSVCTGNLMEKCYYDASCDDPCPDSGALLNSVAEPIDGEEEEPGQALSVTGTTLVSLEVEVRGDEPTDPEYVFLAENKRCEDDNYARRPPRRWATSCRTRMAR